MSEHPTDGIRRIAVAVLDRNPAGTHERNLATSVLRALDKLARLKTDAYANERNGAYLAGWVEAILVAEELWADPSDAEEEQE